MEFLQSVMEKTAKRMGRGGRPPHRPSDRGRRIVELAASNAVPTIKIAEILGISLKTLFKHYRHELDRDAAKVEAVLVMHLHRLAGGKGAVAFRATKFILKARFGWSEYAPPPRG